MEKILIIGKNSSLYRIFREQIRHSFNVIAELGKEDDLGNYCVDKVVVFAHSKNIENIRALLEQISKEYDQCIRIYIGSTALFAIDYSTQYSYVNGKAYLEKLAVDLHFHILRVGVVGREKSKGKYKATDKYTFIRGVKTAGNDSSRVHNVWEQREYERYLGEEIYLSILKYLLKLRIGFYISRIFDLILKNTTRISGGYTLLSNYNVTSLEQSETLIVGNGIASRARQERYKELNVRPEVIEWPFKNDHFIKGSMLFRIGSGGNSSLWHGVLAISEQTKCLLSKIVSAKLVPPLLTSLNHDKLAAGYVFVPFKPIRGIREASYISDYVIKVEVLNDEVIIHGLLRNYRTKTVEICSGTLGSLKLMNRSGLGKDYVIGDHRVGYFGQIRVLRSKDRLNILAKNGHYKKYYLGESKSNKYFVTIRPALGRFKDLSYANNYRSFFAAPTNTIIKRIILRFNLGILNEALYNKFGIGFGSKVFNIVGHAEIKDAIRLSEQNELVLSQDTHKVDEIAFERILSNLRQDFEIEDINILKEVVLSSGIHFMNYGDEVNLPSKIKVFSNYSLERPGPEHPTLHLYLKSRFDD